MTEPSRDLDELRDAVELPSSPTEKIGYLVFGLAMGFIAPRAISQFLLHLVGTNVPGLAMTLGLLGAYSLCLPIVWFFWGRGRYLAIGILIPALVQILMGAVAFALWCMVRTGVHLP